MKKCIRKLKHELSELSDNIAMANKCNEISRMYMYRDLDQVEHFAKLALNHLGDETNHSELGRAYLNLGASSFLRQSFNEAVKFYHKASQLAQNDPITLVRVYMGIGITYTLIQDFEKALFYEEEALKIVLRENYLQEKAAIYNNMGRIYSALNEYELSSNYYNRGLQIATENNFTTIIGYIYVGMIRNNFTFDHLEAMESNLLKLDSLLDQSSEMWFIGISQCLWGCYYLASDTSSTALKYYNTGMEILIDEEQLYYISIAHEDYALALRKVQLHDQANQAYDKYKEMIDHYELSLALPNYYQSRADFHATQGQAKEFNVFHNLYTVEKESLKQIINVYF